MPVARSVIGQPNQTETAHYYYRIIIIIIIIIIYSTVIKLCQV